MSTITTRFISSIEIPFKSFFFVETIWLEILWISVLALENWQSGCPKILIIMFHLDTETLNSPWLEVLYIPRKLESCGANSIDKSNHWVIPGNRILIVQIFQSMQKLWVLWSRHSKSSLSATKGFISSTKSAIETFLLLKNITVNNYSFHSFQWTSDSTKNSKKCFSIWILIEFLTRVSP